MNDIESISDIHQPVRPPEPVRELHQPEPEEDELLEEQVVEENREIMDDLLGTHFDIFA